MGFSTTRPSCPIEEHTTDTHGYTEMIFGAYDLLGLRFAPRIRDLDRQRLDRHGTRRTSSCSSKRSAPNSSFRAGMSCSASPPRYGMGGRRPHCCSRGCRPGHAKAPQEYGRLVKTNFVLAWLADEELRGRVGRQLNKGEQLHALRRAIFYANEGHIRHRT